MGHDRKELFRKVKRIVVKIGSGVLTKDSGLNIDVINSISKQISALTNEGFEILLVSSGAIASGIKKIDASKKLNGIPKKQAAAAIGQAGLILAYEKAFAEDNKKVAQILLTIDDLSNETRYSNAKNTLHTLLSWQVIPIINENDTVAVEEIKFGDNDQLAAMITLLMKVDLMINLTDIDGLYTADPRSNPNAELIPNVNKINEQIKQIASHIPGTMGTGGMLSKILAAQKVTEKGIPMVIAKGTEENILKKVITGQEYGTLFVP